MVRTRLTMPLVLMVLALHPALPGAQSPQSQPAPVLSSRPFELAWTLDGVKGGVVGDAKTGLITNGSVRLQSRKLECLALVPMFDAVLISDAKAQ